jgi:hypothetical protein
VGIRRLLTNRALLALVVMLCAGPAVPTVGGQSSLAPAVLPANQPVMRTWSPEFPPIGEEPRRVETYPIITLMNFANAERTAARVSVTVGNGAATFDLAKDGGVWRVTDITNQWVT